MKERTNFDIKIDRILNILCDQIYDSPLSLLRENVQNAYDAILMEDREAGMSEFLRITDNCGVAYTTGRELVCTSPMNDRSLHECIYVAKDILAARERWDEAHANPLPKLFVDKREDNRRQPKPFPPFNDAQNESD